MRVLGIDPGSIRTGYGIIESQSNTLNIVCSGCIKNKSSDNISTRYKKIFKQLKQVIKKENPDIAALENVIYCNNSRVAIKLGEARGAAILAASVSNIPIAEYAPKKLKQSVVGTGSASKIQVQKMIQNILNLETLPQSDIADALSAAICHINNNKLNLLKK